MPQSPPKLLSHKNFLGLRTSYANPPANSAKNCSNIVIHKHREEGNASGWLEQADGYDLAFQQDIIILKTNYKDVLEDPVKLKDYINSHKLDVLPFQATETFNTTIELKP